MRGIIYALLATISYSSTPTFTQLGYKGGIQTNTLLFSRHLISLIFLFPTLLKSDTFKGLKRDQILGLLLLSCFSIAGNLAFNYAYRYLPNMVSVSVSLAYIVIVFIMEILLGREKLTPLRGLVILMTALGMFIISDPSGSSGLNMKAFLVGIVASMIYSTQVCFINSRIMKDVPTNVILLTGIVPITVFSFIRIMIYGEPLLPSGTTQWIAILCLGTIGVIVARGLFFESIKLIGASRASMIDSLEPLSSAVLGYVFLRQGLTLTTVVGSVLMMLSVLILLKERSSKEKQ